MTQRSSSKTHGSRRYMTSTRPELLVNGTDEVLRNTIQDLLSFAHQLTACRDSFASCIGLAGLQYEIVMAILRREANACGVREVAEAVHRSPAFITAEINKLVEIGMVEKTSHPDDGRRVILSVTRSARQKMRTLTRMQQEVNDSLFQGLDGPAFLNLSESIGVLAASGAKGVALADYLALHADHKAA